MTTPPEKKKPQASVSALARRLTEAQRLQLVQDARSMVEQYRAEMETGFYPKRRAFEKQANADFSGRVSGGGGSAGNPLTGGIFDLSNESLNIVRNVTRFMKARCGEDVFGSKPWFSARPVGGADDALLSEEINRHAPWKLGQAEYTRHGKEAIGTALDLGEAVLKTTHRHETDCFERLELVLVNVKTGEPVLVPQFHPAGQPRLNPDGDHEADYIYPEDPTFEVPEAGKVVFEKAPQIALDASVEFREVLIEEDEVRYHGADVSVVRFEDFIAPLNIASLEQSECTGHVYQRTVSQLRALYETAENSHLFEQLEVEPDGPKSADAHPRQTMGETSSARARLQNNPNIKVTEVYLRGYDVFGDGKGRHLFLVLAADLEEPLYCEYLANVTPRGRLPFSPIVVNRVPGRWYGRGFYELYEGSQRLIDALVNAVLYRNESNADPLVCWQPDATEEGKSEKRLIRGPGKTITLRPGKSAKDAVQIVEFPDLDERTWQLIQLIMQLIQTDSGVTSAAQGDYSALPSASTATGISSILQSASTLHRMLTEDLKDGFEPAVLLALMTIYAKQDADETFAYLEGAAAAVLSLSSARVLAKLEMNVSILLTRFHMREQRESAQLVITQVLPTWMQLLQASGLPLNGLAAAAQPLFVQVAKGSDIQGAEQIFALPAPLPPMLPPGIDPGAAPVATDPNAPPPLPTNVVASPESVAPAETPA